MHRQRASLLAEKPDMLMLKLLELVLSIGFFCNLNIKLPLLQGLNPVYTETKFLIVTGL